MFIEIDNQTPSLKMVLIGNSGVGKTTLVKMWSTNAFEPNESPTIGAFNTLHTMKIEGKDVDVFLWDTAGQEQYAPLSPLFLRQASMIILTISLTDKSSLESIPKWLSLVKQFNEAVPPIILAINKIDLEEKAEFTIEDVFDLYPESDKEKEAFVAIVPVSAKTGNSVDKLFMIAGNEAFDFVKSKKSRTADIVEPQHLKAKKHKSGGCC